MKANVNRENDSSDNGITPCYLGLDLKTEHYCDKSFMYRIFIKVIDIFGVDTSQIYEVEFG